MNNSKEKNSNHDFHLICIVKRMNHFGYCWC